MRPAALNGRPVARRPDANPASATRPRGSAAPASPAARALHTRQRADALASRLPPLLVAAERVASTVAQGVHGRRRVGTGESFWQFRRYEQGDAASMIDWRQSAKADRVFVRENEWEAAQSVWMWCDGSASMDYRSVGDLPTKADRARLLLMALAVLLARGGERVALLGSDRMPGSNAAALERMAAGLSALPPAGAQGDLPPAVALPRFSQVVLAGDLLTPIEEVRSVVTALAGRGVTGHLLQVLDPAEETLPFAGRVEFEGMQGEDELLVPRVEAVRTAYLERLQAQRDGLAALARTTGWTFAGHRTDRPPQTALLSLYAAVSRQPMG